MRENQSYEINKILQEMRDDYWRNLEAVEETVSGSRAEYLVVRCGEQSYGLPAASCREVLRLPRLVRAPRLPGHLRGIFNLRGEIVAVTVLCPLLGRQPQDLDENFRLVVVESGAIRTALLVAAVEGLSGIDDEQVEALAEGAGAGARDLIHGKVVRGEEVLVLLDLSALLERPEMIVDQKDQAGT